MSDVEGDEGQGKSFRVKDNRRFDQEGNERTAAGEPSARVESSASATVSNTVRSSGKESSQTGVTSKSFERGESEPDFALGEASSGEAEPGIEFRSFVISLATQALMQMGVMQPPPGVEAGVDREGARQTIEILNMLAKKTRGNLDAEESKLLEEVLHSLRLNFLRLG